MESAGYLVECIASGADELEDHSLAPVVLALENARRKADAVAARFPGRTVLAADTVVHDGRRFFGKPADLSEATEFLRHLSGRTHEVVTGVVVVSGSGERVEFAESTRVSFHVLDEATISDYLAVIEPLDKAGGYAAQGEGRRIIREVDGDFSNVIGLPVDRVRVELARFGVSA